MKKSHFLMIVIGLFFLVPSVAPCADSIEGTIQGFNCITQKICASSSEDPLVTAEYTFVVVTPDGKTYFLPAVPRAVLAYRDTERVRVKGYMNPKFNKVDVQSIEIFKNRKWTYVWNGTSEFNPIPELYR
jgi:hypothetical protein